MYNVRLNVCVDCECPPFTNVTLKHRMPPNRLAHPVQASMGQRVRPTTPRMIDVVWSPVDRSRFYECFRRGAPIVRSQLSNLATPRLPALPDFVYCNLGVYTRRLPPPPFIAAFISARCEHYLSARSIVTWRMRMSPRHWLTLLHRGHHPIPLRRDVAAELSR